MMEFLRYLLVVTPIIDKVGNRDEASVIRTIDFYLCRNRHGD